MTLLSGPTISDHLGHVKDLHSPRRAIRHVASSDEAGDHVHATASPFDKYPGQVSSRNGDWIAVADNQDYCQSLAIIVCRALLKTGYPLQHVRCWCDDRSLVLSGQVSRYFYAQMAQETANSLAEGRRVMTLIEVVPRPHPAIETDCR